MFNLSVTLFYQSSACEIVFLSICKKYHDTSQIVITLSLLPIALYVSMIQHSIFCVYHLKVFFESSISKDFFTIP